ncbi:MAG: recombinase family protein [Desulfobacterales bacterium]|jgi:DNA invertase Pin-like site-specific DNA recombinase
MLVGYARISTPEQSFDLQIDALEKAGCKKILIFKETVSGAKTKRKALNDALEYVRKDDTLVVWRLDRLGRSLMHLIEVVNDLHERKIGFKSLVDAIDTQTATGQFFFHVTGAFAELERNLIRERTRAGLKAARARSRSGGRPKAIDPKTFQMALEIYNSKTTTVGEMCKRLGIAKRTFYRHLELRNQQQ